MNKNRCMSCYWNGACGGCKNCDNYTPICDDIDNEEYVEKCESERRNDFFSEWFEYANQFND